MRAYNHKISKRANESLRKREAVVQRQKVLCVIIVAIISLSVLFGTTVNTLASSKTDAASYHKYYTSIQIAYGDTLWDIADEYIDNMNISKSEYIDEICRLNSIVEDEIHAGDYIVVPYYTEEMK